VFSFGYDTAERISRAVKPDDVKTARPNFEKQPSTVIEVRKK